MKVKCIRADGALFEAGKSYDAYQNSFSFAARIDVCNGDSRNTTLVCSTDKREKHTFYGAKHWLTDDVYIFIDEDTE